MFDSVCKFLAETFATDFATWLLGQPMVLTQLNPSELSLEPIRADTVIFLQADDIILHIEFQTQPKAEIPFRMLDYRVRLYRRFPDKLVIQIVIYLQPTTSDLVYQNSFTIPRTRHKYRVIRLWEQPFKNFLTVPGLLPFAALSKTSDREATLRQVAARLDNIQQNSIQNNVRASTAILAGLILEKDLVKQILRSDIMKESVIYQDILQEGRQEGLQLGLRQGIEQGIEQGLQQGLQQQQALILRLLNRRVGNIPTNLQTIIEQLSQTQLEDLTEALMDFTTLSDLSNWLESHLEE